MTGNRKNKLALDTVSAADHPRSELHVPSALLELDEAWSDKLTVVFRSDQLGDGDDELGRHLLIEAVNALVRHPEPPEAILFYHRGVRLAAEGSPVLEQMRQLQTNGSCLMICETSLAAYPEAGATIGRAVPLTELLEQMRRADRIIWF